MSDPFVDRELDELRGRCAALEMMIAGFMAREVVDISRDPLGELDKRWSEHRTSLQLLRRTTDDRSERSWEAVFETLERLYDTARGRVFEWAAKD